VKPWNWCAYYKIDDLAVRKRIFELTKSIAKSEVK
jgi:hypothetical protein